MVGMARSGSSVLEHLLTQNADIVGLGDRPEIAKVMGAISRHHQKGYPAGLLEMTKEQYQGFSEISLKQYDQQATGANHIIDKNLRNFQHLGLIKTLFPNCSIIHCRRDPVATCLSSYFQFMPDETYTFDFDDIAKRYAAYTDIMSFWKNIFPNTIIEQKYETLVADQKSSMETLYSGLGLKVDAAQSGAFETRDIQAINAWQARQPIYQHAISHWKNYESHLGPLFTALKDAGVHYEGDG